MSEHGDTKPTAADGAYDTRDIYNYCNKNEIKPLNYFAGNLHVLWVRSVLRIDKKSEPSSSAQGKEGTAEYAHVSRDCVLYVQLLGESIMAKMGKRQDGDIRKGVFVQSDDRYGN